MPDVQVHDSKSHCAHVSNFHTEPLVSPVNFDRQRGIIEQIVHTEPHISPVRPDRQWGTTEDPSPTTHAQFRNARVLAPKEHVISQAIHHGYQNALVHRPRDGCLGADELQGPVQRLTLRGGREHRGTVAAARQFFSRLAFSVPGPEPRLYPAACDRCGVQQAKERWSNESYSAFVERGPVTGPGMVSMCLRLVHEMVKECDLCVTRHDGNKDVTEPARRRH